eukprot:1194982-Prorocentrum_minimum.AAC.13
MMRANGSRMHRSDGSPTCSELRLLMESAHNAGGPLHATREGYVHAHPGLDSGGRGQKGRRQREGADGSGAEKRGPAGTPQGLFQQHLVGERDCVRHTNRARCFSMGKDKQWRAPRLATLRGHTSIHSKAHDLNRVVSVLAPQRLVPKLISAGFPPRLSFYTSSHCGNLAAHPNVIRDSCHRTRAGFAMWNLRLVPASVTGWFISKLN